MEVVAATGKPVVFCLMTGSAMDLRYPTEHFNAIMQLWYPGARGGRSVAEVLFGEVSPSGKLPVTFYETAETLPEFTDYNMKGRTYRYMEEAAQYPFGFGLSYGKAEVTDAVIANISKEKDLPTVQVKVTIENKGIYNIEEVVQLYIKNADSKYAVNNPILCGFKRVSVKAGR